MEATGPGAERTTPRARVSALIHRPPAILQPVLPLVKRIPGVCWLCLLAVLPASAQQRFDAAQLLTDVRVLAADSLEGRRAGSAGAAMARAYIQAAYERYGLRPLGQGYAQPFPFTRGREAVQGVNLLGYVPGSEHPDAFIVLSAHYDHLGIRGGEIFNGADDNASGVAGLLAAAAYFSRNPPRHSVLFAALDAEESGLQGARAFLAQPPVPLESIRLNVNLDMISRNERDELFVAGTYHYPALKPYLEEVAARSRLRLRFGHDQPRGAAGQDWTTASDHGPFHRAGIPFVYFGVEDHADYHQPTDDYARIDPSFFIRAVDTILDAVVVLDAGLEAFRPASSH